MNEPGKWNLWAGIITKTGAGNRKRNPEIMLKILGLTIVVMLVFTVVMMVVFFAKKDRQKSGGCCGGDACSAHEHGDSGCNCN